MKEIARKFRRVLFFEMAFSLVIAPLAAEEYQGKLAAIFNSDNPNAPTFTINFNNVSMLEYVRFVSKISGLNFIFDEADLQFPVTIVSEEPLSIKNILSTLIQVLRVHGLSLLEQENNLLITKSKDVNQIATLVAPGKPLKKEEHPPIVTRIFRVKNMSPASVASIIRPMTSSSALIEVSPETHQLIITDITTNVDKIAALLVSLDTPHTPLEIETYTSKHLPLNNLIALAKDIVMPFAEGNPLIFVPQEETQTIFIVSTPYLLEKTMTVLEDLDSAKEAGGAISPDNVFIYSIQYKSAPSIIESLNETADDLAASKRSPTRLIDMLKGASPVKDSNSILFIGDADSWEKVKEILATIDAPMKVSAQTLFVYKALHTTVEQLEGHLEKIASNLEDTHGDPEVIKAIDTMKAMPSTQSIIFTGTPSALEQIKQILIQFDGPSVGQLEKSEFFIYKPHYRPAQDIQSALDAMAKNLEDSGLIDSSLLEAITSARYVSSTESLLFTGTPESLQKIKDLLATIDVSKTGAPISPLLPSPGGPREEIPSTFVLYKPRYLSGDELVSILCDFAHNLNQAGVADPGLYDAINNLKWIDKTSSLLISGSPDSIKKVQDLIAKFDIPSGAAEPAIETIDMANFLVYKLQYHQGEEIQSALKQIATELSNAAAGSASHQALISAINSIQWIKITNSLIATGGQDTLTKLRDLIQNLDIPLRQVFIEVLVVETSMTNTQNFGLQWGGKFQYLDRVAGATGAFPANSTTPTPAPVPSGGVNGFNLNAINATTTPVASDIPFLTGWDLGVIGDIIMHKGKSFISLGSLVNALETDTDSTIVLNPKIITQDNNNSTIFVGQNVPFTGSLVTTTGANVLTNTSLEYRDIGLNMSITPVLGNNDVVTLDIQTDISELEGRAPTITAGSVVGLQTTHTNMNTRVHVPNDHFLVLSGMIRNSTTHFKSQIPCLGGLPIIGLAFQENDRLKNKTNIIIFIRPHIINAFEEYKEITEHQEKLYRNNAELPALKEEFDEGVDLVKTPENE